VLTIDQIRNHYRTKAILNTIIRVSTDGEYSRAGMKCTPEAYVDRETGELKDSMDWYRGTGTYKNRKFLKKIDLSTGTEGLSVNINRTLYWTLNLFDKEIYNVDFKSVTQNMKPLIARDYTCGYTLGIDIDKEHSKDIHDPAVKAAVEAMAQFYCDRLRERLPNSVYVLYSGGGIYVMVHHKVFEPYFAKFRLREDWEGLLRVLLDSFDALIGDLRDEFFKRHPECKGLVKPDQLNGSQRVFKSIFSIHKNLDYAVIPLNPVCVKIDFDKATMPLSNDVIEAGKTWYSRFDDGKEFLNTVMKPYFEKYHHLLNRCVDVGDIEISSIPISDIGKWAPCMRNLYNLQSCGEGATRALAVFVSYLGQIGIHEDIAFDMFNALADRWDARKSNIFESYFRKMSVPACRRLTANDDRGFPKGVSIKNLGVCKPDVRCMNVPSPRYRTDSEANKKRLLKTNVDSVESIQVEN
jgi:hypothetical protein